MKKITLFLALFVIFVTTWSYGQGPAGSYSFTETTESYSAVTGTNSTATGDDGSENAIPIGFTFNFDGTDYTTFSINTNGFIRLQTNIGASPWTNSLGTTAAQRPLIAAFWDDNNRGTGSIQYLLSGTAPNQTLEIDWNNVNIGGGGTTSTTQFASFKIRLHQTTNVIEIIYAPTMDAAGGLSASVGINGASTFLSVTPAATSTVSNATANNLIAATTNVVGKKYVFTPPVLCTGTPVAGSVTPALQNLCSGSTPANLVATGYSSGVTGLTFQWEESDDNGVADAWANAVGGTGATTATYTPPAFSGTTIYYRLNVTCSNSAMSAQTASVMVAPPANPTTQVTNANATNVLAVSATVNWTNGNGARRLVILSNSATITDPVNGNAPALVANTVYAGTGQQIIYDGTATTVNVTGLSATTTYYVHVYEYLRCGAGPYDYYFNTTLGTNVTSFTTIAPPVNDNCSGASALTVGENFAANPLTGTNVAASNSNPPAPGCANFLGGDVWYSVVVPASGNVTIETGTGTVTDTGMAVYSGACGALTLIECDDDDSANGLYSLIALTGQTPGTTLYVNVWEYGNNVFGTFQVSAYDCPSATPAPTGDAAQSFCTSATVADLVATGTAIKWYTTMTGGTAMATTDALTTGTTYYASQTINCESYARLAVTVTIDTVPADPTGNAAQTYCSTIDGTLAALSVTGSGIVWYDAATAGNVLPTTTTLVAGSTYYAEATSGACVSAGRLAVTVSELCPCLTSPNGQYPAGTYTPTTCDGATVNQVTNCGWGGEYSVVTVTLGQTYTFSSSITTDIITISADGGATVAAYGIGSVTWVSTIDGTVRFYTHIANCAAENICRIKNVVCGTPPTTVPDCPTLVAPADMSVDLGTSVTLSWTAPTTGSPLSSYNVYLDTNNPPTTLVGNVTGLTNTVNNLTPSTTYYWMINSVNVVGESTGCTIYSFTTVAAPVNDNCATASALTVGENFAANPLIGTNVAASNSNPPAPGCASFAGGDVWYSVVVPASGNVTIETGTGTIADTGMAVYSGACGALTLIECDDDDSANGLYSLIALTGQTPGTTLYVNVWEYSNNAFGTFQVSAYDCPSATSAPTGNAAQSFCDSATVADLVATGTAIKWYTTMTGGTALATTTALTTGTTYYASQTINCESYARLAVTVTITPTVTTTFDAIAPLCAGSTAPTLPTTSTNGVTGTWSPATIDNMATATYTFTPDAGQCATTVMLDVTVISTAAPTGASSQTFCAGELVSMIAVTGTSVVWYTDATGTTVVDGSTPIADGTTYYAAQTLNGCESADRLAVTMTLGACLGVTTFDDSAFNYYPNPIIDVLNISYSNTIDSVEVINLTGQQIFVKKFNTSDVSLDMNNLPSGVYILNVTSENKVKTIKVIKK